MRVGLGRKASGSYYTPHSFVRFLVQETLGPQVEERSPQNDPKPLEILKLKVLDPAMGSGHFLVEACRFLGEKLYEACRSCDEKALEAERKAETANTNEKQTAALEAAKTWRQRIIDLPDTDDELAKTEFVPRESKVQALEPVMGYLPSKSPTPGVSTPRAQAICRRLVAVHCLYGVDKNPLAVELAKLALWLESHAEGMPLTFLDHRLVVGDSLTGPFWEKLLFRPSSPETRVENLFSLGLHTILPKALTSALGLVRRLESSVGSDLADVLDKEKAKAELDQALMPFRIAVVAWTGGVMLGPGKCDDLAYGQLLEAIGRTGRLPGEIESAALRAQIALGLGLESVPEHCDGLEAAANSTKAVPALSYDLTFPEVFYPLGTPHGKQGFHAVIGNPPWDAVWPKAKEFFASFDFAILDAPTKRERSFVEKSLKDDPVIAALHKRYEESISEQQRAHDALFRNQIVVVNGQKTGGNPDLAKLFLERAPQLLRRGGLLGSVVPSAFHANEGATGIRRLYFEKLNLRYCYSFENRRKLFDIDSRFKFATLVAQVGEPTEELLCAFYLHNDEWLFESRGCPRPLCYKVDFIRRTGGEYLSLLELRSAVDLEVAEVCFSKAEPFGSVCDNLNIRLGRELHMTDDSWRLTPTAEVFPNGEDPRDHDVAEVLLQRGYLVLHEGKTFRQYDDHWGVRPRYCVSLRNLRDKPDWLRGASYYRPAFRVIAGPGDENISIWNLHPCGVATGDKGQTNREPWKSRTHVNLVVVGVGNSYVFDWLLQLRVRATLNLFILNSIPFPIDVLDNPASLFVSHCVLRLTSNHSGYSPLWQEQLCEAWREPGKPRFSWPVLANDDDRWHVRASIDAVVADAYGLSRDQYAQVLSTFKHTSYPEAPKLCLARFDELKAIGLEAFTKKHDPYWDVPLNENLPQPVIELPIPGDAIELTQTESYKLSGSPKRRSTSKSKKQ